MRTRDRTWVTRWAIVAFLVIGFLALGAAGAAYAGYRYDRSRSDRALPGVRIGNVDVGGMTRVEMEAALQPRVRAILDRTIRISVGRQQVTRTIGTLGVEVDVGGAIDRALSATNEFWWPSRVYHRLLDRPVDRRIDLVVAYRSGPVARFVRDVAPESERAPVDASLDVVDGKVVVRHSRHGRELATGAARTTLSKAVDDGARDVVLPVRSVEPAITDRQLGPTIVVRLSRLQLYLYRGTKLEKTYPVAAGRIGVYDTPQGHWTIIAKRANPTWYNPALDSWGAGEPAVVPPGPNNPMGPRALYLNVGLIRIHGTSDDSSIGHYVSHGCVRLHNSDIVDLFDRVDVGTPVIITW